MSIHVKYVLFVSIHVKYVLSLLAFIVAAGLVVNLLDLTLWWSFAVGGIGTFLITAFWGVVSVQQEEDQDPAEVNWGRDDE